MMNSTDILKSALQLVSEGWMQYAYYDRQTNCVCAAGAIYMADSAPTGLEHALSAAGRKAMQRLANVIDPINPSPILHYLWPCTEPPEKIEDPITCWNDADTRTKEEVIAAFRKAIGDD